MAMSHLGAFVPSKYFAFIYVLVYSAKDRLTLTALNLRAPLAVGPAAPLNIIIRELDQNQLGCNKFDSFLPKAGGFAEGDLPPIAGPGTTSEVRADSDSLVPTTGKSVKNLTDAFSTGCHWHWLECACIGERLSDMRSKWLLHHPRSRITTN
jgi:hypothetical protein